MVCGIQWVNNIISIRIQVRQETYIRETFIKKEPVADVFFRLGESIGHILKHGIIKDLKGTAD